MKAFRLGETEDSFVCVIHSKTFYLFAVTSHDSKISYVVYS